MGTDKKIDTLTDLLAAKNELKLAQEKISNANRLYSFISHINQMIIRTTDEFSLFKEACQIATNVGRFRMAWIGKLDANTNKIIPIVHAGEESEYLSMINPISIDDIPEGRGPTGSALREGKYFVSNDIRNDPQMLPWKFEAKAAGYSSSIALPIKKDGKTIAAFSIYSSSKNFFDSSEIKLLLEVVDDLSFAVATIEKEKYRNWVEHQLVNNEARFRALIEKSADMISMVSSDGKILYASPAFTKELGYTNDELLSIESIQLIHSDDLEDFHKNLQDLLKSPGKTIFIEQRHIHKNGNYVWCEGTITNSLNESGINALVGNFKNVTEKREAAILLNDSFIELEKINKEQSAILNTLPANIALLDRDGNIVKVNDEWMKFGRENGINPQYSYTGVNYIDVSKSSTGMDAESGDFMAEGIVSILKGKKEDFSLDYPCHSPNQQRWFRAEVRPLSGNRDSGIVVMHTDITERKRAEEEIKLLINNTEESFILLDNNLKIVSFNNQFQRLYKEYFNVNVKKGDWIIDYAQPERKEIVTAIYKRVLNGHVELSEITVPVTVENVRAFSLKYSPAKDISGSIFGVFVTISDITDKKKAEQLKEFEKRDKEALINNTDDLIWSVTPDIKLIAANNSFIKSMERYYGIIIKSGDSLFIEGLFPAEYLELWKKLYQKALGKQAFKIEIFTESANQENEMWTETNFNPIVSNYKVVAIACYSRNITERKKSEEIIKQNEQRLAEAQALAKVGNWETDLQTLVVTWSDETFRIFEVNPKEFKKSHPAFIQYVHPDDKDEVNKLFYDSFETKTVNVIEHRIITPKGNEKILEERWQIIRDKNNQPIRAVGTCQDITERKIAEIERTKITNDLIQRNRDLEQFAFIISHNLRAPTANIIGFSENLLNETLTPEEEKEFLKGLTISVNRLDGVIKDLNKIIQTRRETDGKKETISFPALVKDIAISIENVIEKNNVKFITDFSEISEIYSLKGYVHSIFFNLISNSIKYRNPTIEPIIEISSKFKNGKIILVFQDNGLGIDLKTKGDKIFGLYKRFHSHVEGKGLGLFMVKTQVEALGGTINISSEPNKGTMFTIEFQS